MNNLFQLINDIMKAHERFSKQFFSEPFINLKKTQVCDIYVKKINIEFFKLIYEYLDALNSSDYLGKYSIEPNISMRVKNKNSILNKLEYYRFKNEEGKFPLNKVLNDIFGLRFIIATDKTYAEIKEEIVFSFGEEAFRCYERPDGNYHALHLHFKNQNNFYFPWELQIWKEEDRENNENSHREHKIKRRYIDWTKKYEEG